MGMRHLIRKTGALAPWVLGCGLAALCAATAGAQTPAPAAQGAGRVHLIVFDEANAPRPGIAVELTGGAAGVTDANGSIELEGPTGEASLALQLPFVAEGHVHREPITVYAQETIQVLLTIANDGSLVDRDVEAPSGPAVAAATVVAAQAPPGVLAGSVVAEADATPVAGAKVYVQGSDAEAETDASGRFRLDVPSGTLTVSIIHSRFSTLIKRDVAVRPGEQTVLTLTLAPASIELDEFVVTVPKVEGSVAHVFEERRNTAAVTDALGAEDLAKSPDSSASTATRRIVGATIVDGKYLYVRGLGGRYTNVRLNGVPLPSIDPDVPGVQLDLFPANLLNDLTIAKTFTANIPGDFAGGSMNIETRSFPEELTANLSLGTAFNTESVFQPFTTYPGGKLDWLGVDDGTRALPAEVPNQPLVAVRRGEGLTQDEVNDVAKSFASIWETEQATGMPDLRLSGSVGNTFDVAGHDLGMILSLNYKNEMRSAVKTLGKVTADGDDVRLQQQLTEDVSQQEASIGGLANLGYELADGHELRLVSFYTQVGTDQAGHVTGYSEEDGNNIDWTRLNFTQRQLFFNQLLGTHEDVAGDLDLDWQFNFDLSRRNQPDGRSLLYNQPTEEGEYAYEYAFRAYPGSGERLYTELDQHDIGGGLNLRQPIWDGEFGTGYMTRYGDREFVARRFTHSFIGTTEQRFLPPNELFELQGEAVQLAENTSENDGYVSSDRIHAGYLTLDTPWNDWFKSHAGVRVEAYHQVIQTDSPFSGAEPGDPTERTDIDGLPSGALMFALSDTMSVRGAYGGTVGRPLARELAPFLTNDYSRRRTVQGNPDLQRTYIHNADLRWELFPTPTEVIAVSTYYKKFRHPIETIIKDSNGNVTFDNAEDAQTFGAELEARASFGHLSDSLEDFTFLWNLSMTYSRVTLTDEQAAKATDQERPMAGQSPWVINASIGYEPEKKPFRAFIYYNVFGPRIVEVGSLGLPDVIEQPFHSLDFTAFYDFTEHWQLSVSGKNLAFQAVRTTQGPYDFETYEVGAEFGAKITWRN
jgi:hypothetical protein